MTSENKTAFRKTIKWRDFRKQLLKTRGMKCEVCGTSKKGLNIHHCDEDDYTNLDPDLFIILCKTEHRNIHRLMRKKVFDIDLYVVAFKDAYIRSKK